MVLREEMYATILFSLCGFKFVMYQLEFSWWNTVCMEYLDIYICWLFLLFIFDEMFEVIERA